MILGVWKVLAALLHHLLNSASAVSSWFEFAAEACLFGVCSPVVSLRIIPLHFSTTTAFAKSFDLLIIPLSQVHFKSHGILVCGNI